MKKGLVAAALWVVLAAWSHMAEGQGCANSGGIISLNPNKLDFGTVQVGSSSTRTFTIVNVSTSNPLKIKSLSSLDSQFVIRSPKTPPFCLAMGAAVTVSLDFVPLQAGNVSSKIRITSGDRSSPHFVFVSGAATGGGAPDFVASPTSLDFGDVLVGSNSTRTFTLKNQGNAAGTVSQINNNNSAFGVTSPAFPRNVSAGNQFSVTVLFSPGKTGALNGTLSIKSGASTVATVALTGNGTRANPEIDLSPAAIDFGSMDVGTFRDKFLKISNTGGADLELQLSADPKAQTTPSGKLTIGPGKTQQIKVRLIADAFGPFTRNLHLTTNDPDESKLNVQLFGTGVHGKLGLLNATTRSRIGNNRNDTSGVQWVDFNGDGKEDIFLTGHDGNILFKNMGNGQFANMTGPSKLGNGGKDSTGASWGDVDNDGDPDLFIANAGAPSQILKNNKGNFANQGGAFGLFAADDTSASQGGIWLDFNNDGRLDLFIVRDGKANQLFQQVGSFRFTDVAGTAGVNSTGPGRSAVSADFNNDGFQDLYVVNFQRPNKLYLNNKNGTFRDATGSAGVGFSGASRQAVVADYDADGDLDIFVANSDGTSVMYRNNGKGKFTNSTGPSGLGGPKKATGATFTDYDNDGDQDLLIIQATGQNTLFRNTGNGKFVRVSNVDISSPSNPSATSSGDSNNDGTPDSVVGSSDSTQQNGDTLYQNAGGEGNNWLVITLQGTRSNRSAIGARVVLRAGALFQAKVVSGGNGQNQDSLPLEFGLGSATSAGSIIISWPSGTIQTLQNVAANQRLKITEPAD